MQPTPYRIADNDKKHYCDWLPQSVVAIPVVLLEQIESPILT
jgi:hypothetical protein